jgi:sugar/nucleoside kinase (ribokinase family)
MADPKIKIASLIVGPIRSEFHILPDRQLTSCVLGGPAAYAAAGYRIWSNDTVGLVSRVGNSIPKEWIRRFHSAGFLTESIRQLPEPQPWVDFVAYENWGMRFDNDPQRWFAAYRLPFPPALSKFQPPTISEDQKDNPPDIAIRLEDIPVSYFQAHGALLAPSHLFSQFLISVALHTHGVGPIFLCPSARILRPEKLRDLAALLHGVDFFFAKASSALPIWANTRHRLSKVAEEIAKLGPRIVLLHRGLDGVHVFDADSKSHFDIPGYPLSPLDITGMEDAFCGGFLAGWLATYDPIESGLRGVISSSIIMEGSGVLPSFHHTPDIAEQRLSSLRKMLFR